jgi:hypothetical protein
VTGNLRRALGEDEHANSHIRYEQTKSEHQWSAVSGQPARPKTEELLVVKKSNGWDLTRMGIQFGTKGGSGSILHLNTSGTEAQEILNAIGRDYEPSLFTEAPALLN